MQLDGPVAVIVSDAEQATPDHADDIEFFEELATKRFDVGFVRVALAAGKFPMPSEMAAVRAQGQKEFAGTLDDGGNDKQRSRFQGSKVSLEPWNSKLSALARHPDDELAGVVADLVVVDAEIQLAVRRHRDRSRDIADGEWR
jgi:hypothetical protein